MAEKTKAFYFEKPDNFEFNPGQYLEIKLIDPPETDAEGNSRALSIASAPTEDWLMVVTRIRESSFKRTLGGASPGMEIQAEGPFGNFTLHKDSTRPALLLAGGIGVTPFLSIVKQATTDKSPQKIFLFYSNRILRTAAFMDLIKGLEVDNPNFKFIPTMTDNDSEWAGESGYINRKMISKYAPQDREPVYYIAGPAEMVAGMRREILESGVSEDDMRFEEFTGY